MDPVFHFGAATVAVLLVQIVEEERHPLFIRESCKETVVQDIVFDNEFERDISCRDIQGDFFLIASGNMLGDWAEDVVSVHFHRQRVVETEMERQFVRMIIVETDSRLGCAMIDTVEGVVDIHEAVGIGHDVERSVAFVGRIALNQLDFPIPEEGYVE